MDHTIPSLLKPTLKTKFWIDFDWWKSKDRNWRNALLSYLCDEHQSVFEHTDINDEFDLVDPVTAKVTRGDALLNTLINHCATQPGFISENAPIVDTIFKVFLVNHNEPQTAKQLSEVVHQSAEMILRTIGTGRTYKGIRPL
ncbi:MAG: hypothetical protein ACOYKD_07285 [Anaerolineaceae bacterium]|jgi:hypothetical protein